MRVYNANWFFIAIDRIVVVGNHHDAWVMGAVDPSSGSSTLMEIVRAVGVALRKGKKIDIFFFRFCKLQLGSFITDKHADYVINC